MMSSRPSLPDDPVLASVARALEQTRQAASLFDAEWRLVWVAEEMKVLLGEEDEGKLGYGKHVVEAYLSDVWSSKITPESQLRAFFEEFPLFMHDTPGGKQRVKELVCDAAMAWTPPSEWSVEGDMEEALDAVFEALEPVEPPLVRSTEIEFLRADLPPTPIVETHVRLHDPTGRFVGTALFYDPALPARVLDLVARGDAGMLERMVRLFNPGRRRAAMLFADLESSGVLSRRLPSAAYFNLVRGIVTSIDAVIVEHRGIVGKHAGDGVTAFFLADDLGSTSAAARAAIEAGRAISDAVLQVARTIHDETGVIVPEDCVVNVGVHWGGTLYMGQLVTGGRLEVTALGDEVNEGARIQEAASGGGVLVSKSLIEHLSDDDASILGIDPDAVRYQTVAELPGATDKAKRDAGTLPVTALSERHGEGPAST